MAIRTSEDILNSIRAKIGDENDDATLEILEDITDTFNDFEDRLNNNEDWKTKYMENDKKWREKYAERFFSKEPEPEPEPEPEIKTYADLFENI